MPNFTYFRSFLNGTASLIISLFLTQKIHAIGAAERPLSASMEELTLPALSSEISIHDTLPDDVLLYMSDYLSCDDLMQFKDVSTVCRDVAQESFKKYTSGSATMTFDFSNHLTAAKEFQKMLNVLNFFNKKNQNFPLKLALPNFDPSNLVHYNLEAEISSRLPQNIFAQVHCLTLSTANVLKGFDHELMHKALENTGLQNVKKLTLQTQNSSANRLQEQYKKENFKRFCNIFQNLESFHFVDDTHSGFFDTHKIGIFAASDSNKNLKNFTFEGTVSKANAVINHMSTGKHFKNLDTLEMVVTDEGSSMVHLIKPTQFPNFKMTRKPIIAPRKFTDTSMTHLSKKRRIL